MTRFSARLSTFDELLFKSGMEKIENEASRERDTLSPSASNTTGSYIKVDSTEDTVEEDFGPAEESRGSTTSPEVDREKESFCARTFMMNALKLTKEQKDAAYANLTVEQRQMCHDVLDKLREERDWQENG